MAARSNSTGVKLSSSPAPTSIEPPRTLRTVYRPRLVRSMSTERRVSSVMCETYLPDRWLTAPYPFGYS
jgi:hypothetical protein